MTVDPADHFAFKTNAWRATVWFLWGTAMTIVAAIIFGQ